MLADECEQMKLALHMNRGSGVIAGYWLMEFDRDAIGRKVACPASMKNCLAGCGPQLKLTSVSPRTPKHLDQ
jgi:hypothetical protein